MYYIRLDDACEKRNVENWNYMEELLDKYNIKPIVGIIPNCKDPDMEKYPVDNDFWNKAKIWNNKGWHIALHGYEHVFHTTDGGINPVNNYSEFAGVALDEQKNKIMLGNNILKSHGLNPTIFFAPAHTFDLNTLRALKEVSDIHIISDTISNKPYFKYDFCFIPQQSGKVRNLPFHTVTFCYHPNCMSKNDFDELEVFIKKNRLKFKNCRVTETRRQKSYYDKILQKLYFIRRK